MESIDLHTHSTYSDGTMTPSELVEHAHISGLSAIALTDHDTMEGVAEALLRGSELGIEVVPGIEISSQQDDLFMHILGYGLDPENSTLLKRISKIQAGRFERNEKIINKLSNLGINVTPEDLQTYSQNGQAGRPHIASMLLDRRIVRTQEEAFKKYLRRGGKAYADRFRYHAQDAIKMIKEAGGLAVLAHPITIAPRLSGIKELIRLLQPMGLDGIEVYYPGHSSSLIRILEQIAHENGMLLTGGSDFHGDNKPGIRIGMVFEYRTNPYRLLEEMKKRL